MRKDVLNWLPRWPLPFVLLLGLPGCGAPPAQERSSINNNDSAAILRRIGLTLPPYASIEYAEDMSGIDDAARLLLVMPEADWRAFLAGIVRQVPRSADFSENANALLGPSAGKWDPAGAKGLKTGQMPWRDEAEWLNIGYAPAGAGKVRVFVFWFQT